MKIVFDITPLERIQAGIGYYTFNLIKHIMRLAPEHQFSLFGRSGQEPNIGRVTAPLTTDRELDIHLSKMPLKAYYYLWKYAKLSVPDLIIPGGDIFHGTSYLPLSSTHGKNIITIHDLYFLKEQKHVEQKARSFLPSEIKAAANLSDYIIADSESTRNDVINLLDISPDKVRAIPLASGENFIFLNDQEENRQIRVKYAGGQPYILFVGTLEPRKNLVRLVQAFSLLKKKGCPHKLVLAGKRGWGFEEIFSTIRRLGLEQEVCTPDYVPSEELTPLYNGADIFVYPSLYEGFGLPVIEAMACGTPVITSNTSSLPEVAGEAGILTDPEDIEGLAQAMAKVLEDGELRKTLREKGLKQAASFSWDKTAAQTLEVYQSLL